MQTRYLNNRRTDLLGACNFPPGLESNARGVGSEVMSSLPVQLSTREGHGRARRVELFPVGDVEETVVATGFGRYSLPPFMRSLAPFFAFGDGDPPPYAAQSQSGKCSKYCKTC